MYDNGTPHVDPIREQPDTNEPPDPVAGPSVQSPRPSRRPWTVGIAAAWLLIIATIAITQQSQSPDQQTTRPDLVNDTTIQLLGRYAVGMNNLLGNVKTLEYFKPQLEEMLQRTDNPRNHLSIIPILAELSPREDVLRKLNELRDNPPNDYVARDVPLFQQLYRDGVLSLSPRQRQDIENYGWIGKLALTQDMAPSDPERRAVVQSGLRTFVAVILFTVVVVALLAVGLVLLFTAIILRAKKRLKTRFSVVRANGGSLLEAFAIYIFGFLALPILAGWIFPDYPILPSLFLIPAVVIALVWPSIRGSKWSDIRNALGWTRGSGFFREAGSGIIGYIAGLPLLAVSTVLVLAISRFTGTTPTHPIVNEIRSDPIVLILLLGLASVWAPVIEEIFFRGALFGYLRQRWSWPVASALTGFLFAVIHPQGWVAVPALTTIGFILGAIREWRGSIIAPMTAHALNNSTILLLVIFALT